MAGTNQAVEQPVEYPNMDYVWSIESDKGQDRNSLVPNKRGALGHYQLTQPAWDDLQRVYPAYRAQDYQKVALDPNMSRQAASDYFKILAGYLKHYKLLVTTENMLAAYNWGIGNIVSSKANQAKYPPETRIYLGKYQKMRKGEAKAKAVKGR